MSNGIESYDELKTIGLLRSSNPRPIESDQTWLRHYADTEAGFIDLMIFQGKYSIDEMVSKLRNNPRFKKKTNAQWKQRILLHIRHLEQSSDSNSAQIKYGHSLKIQSSHQGIVRFDY